MTDAFLSQSLDCSATSCALWMTPSNRPEEVTYAWSMLSSENWVCTWLEYLGSEAVV